MRACSAALAAAVLVAVTGCSGAVGSKDIQSAEGNLPGVTVSGPVGREPTVRMAAPLRVTSPRTSVIVEGTGPAIAIDQLFVLQLSLYDARTGRRATSTYDATPLLAKSSGDSLFPALSKALVGLRQGSRVALSLPAADAFGAGGVPPPGVRPDDPVVVVADVAAVPPAQNLPTADGEPVSDPEGPAVTVLAGDPTRIAMPPGAGAPSTVRVITLVRGTGPKVRDHSLVTLDFLGQEWGRPVPFSDTYFKEPALVPIGAGGSVAAWDQALVGVRRGSRVLVLAPPDEKAAPSVVDFPDNVAIAWVIDVLGVS